ncbi:MAG: galactosyltransferase-related protein [Phycisphaerales bacterium]
MAAVDAAPGVFILIPTHTTRHLAACLASLAHQTRPPRGVVVTCDTDDASIGALLDEWWPRVCGRLGSVPLWHTFRPHQGRPQLNQVRNNGLRALRDRAGIRGSDCVLVLDGDTMLAPDAVENHAVLRAGGAELVIPYRYMLDEATTRTIDAGEILAGGVPEARLTTPDMVAQIEARDRRYRKNLFLSRWGLTKGHKPKLVGGHHAAAFARLVEINGFDEEYVGYRFNDDDLCRRLRALRPRVQIAIAVKAIAAYHLWHPIRAPERLQDAPGFARWSRKDLPVRCVRGIDNPLEQPVPSVREVGLVHAASLLTRT